MSTLLNSTWYDDNGSYVPLADRDSKGLIDRIMTDNPSVVEYTQIGGYLHICVTPDCDSSQLRETVAQELETRIALDREYEHTFRYIDGKDVVVLKMT